MQNKGSIKFLAIVLGLICLYQLSFTFVVGKVEKEAKEFAGGDALKEQAYLDSIAYTPVMNILVASYTYQECKQQELNLGLDLKGGMNVTLEVAVEDILKSLAGNSQNAVFNAALQNAKGKQTDAQEDFITLFATAFEEENAKSGGNTRLASPYIFGTKSLSTKYSTAEPTDEEVLRVVRDEANAAIGRAFTVLRARIDKFGVAQPNIQLVKGTGRIIIELPGVKDPDRVKKLLQSTAQLEFWETYEVAEVGSFIIAANGLLQETEKQAETLDETAAAGDLAAEDSAIEESIVDKVNANAGDSLASDTTNIASLVNPLFDVLSPNFSSQGFGRGPVVGYAEEKDTARINSYLNRADIRALLPSGQRNAKFLWSAKPTTFEQEDGPKEMIPLIAIKTTRDGVSQLSGDVISDASKRVDPLGEISVQMVMDGEGARIWKKMTEQNKGKSIAVVLDDYVYSFPTVNDVIGNGISSISGGFSVTEADDLANILKAGKLPAKARIIQAEVVGPSLGQEAIDSGVASFVAALILVLLYMMLYYANAGVASVLALLANMFFIFGTLASYGAVLTLPGIAGIVLTIGMSVDANVLIYERVREELALGKSIKQAVADGYKNAYAAIIDANVTTLLTGIILFSFGSGPIKGFATTLIIGILTSLFSAIFLTRLVIGARLEKGRGIKFATKATEGLFKNTKVGFMAKRKMAYIISGVIIIAGVISLSTKGLDQGVDFLGGRTYTVRFDNTVSTGEVREALGKVFLNEDGKEMLPEVKTIGSDNQVKITTKFMLDVKGEDGTVDKIVLKGVEGIDGGSAKIMSSSLVGETISDDIRQAAYLSIVFSLIVIFLYILIRFRKWQYSMGAVVAVFHDVLIVLSLFSILAGILPFSLEIDQAFIAAILTVIGYSLNDTVVVFDRIRERLAGKKAESVLVDKALNSTLSRTINTSVTTFFVLLVIFIFGAEVIRGFMFALMIGVVVGTYSSLFIAAPVMMDTIKDKEEEAK